MNPNPEQPDLREPVRPSGLPFPPRVAREPVAEVRVSRTWMLAVLLTLVLTSAGGIAGAVVALLGAREAAGPQEQLTAIHGELIRIRQILESDSGDDEGEGVQTQKTARLSISGQPSLGSPTAPLTLVEFTDFQCPFCARFHAQTFPLLKKAFIEPGRVRYVTVDFPLTSIHPEAFSAARASHCGEEQGKYWDTHKALFSQRGQLGRSAILAAVRGLGMNVQRFSACLDSDAHDSRIKQGLTRGRAIGVSGTPTFILGRVAGSTVVGRVVVGAQPYEVFDDLIRGMLDMI